MENVSWLSFSDSHHGAKSYEEMYREFYTENGLIPTLNDLIPDPGFLGVFLTGDYYDKKLDLNDSKAKLASQILLEILETCKLHGKYFIILRGTYSHEFSQLDNFSFLQNTYNKFFIINTATVLNLKEVNMKILCLPEEYMNDQEAYYKKFLSPKNKYNLILGHGLFKYNCFQENESERPMANMPIFDENQLMAISDIIIFGHVHTSIAYKNKLYYNGSYSRLCFGEEAPKGFWAFEYNTKTREHDAVFVENTLAPTYKTFLLEKILKKTPVALESIVQLIEKYKATCDNLKIKISKEFSNENYTIVESLKHYFYNKNNVVIDAGSFSLKTNKNVASEEDALIRDLEYEFLYTNNNLNEKILKFIEVKHKDTFEITMDDLNEALSESDGE